MPLRPHQAFNLIVSSAALALLAEGALLWHLSARAPQTAAPTTPEAVLPPVASNGGATNNSAPVAPPAPLFVAPGTAPGTAPQEASGSFDALPPAPKTAPGRAVKIVPLAETKRLAAKKFFEAGSQALARKDTAAALLNFRRVAQIAPDNLPTRLNLALLYLGAKRPAEAVPHLRRAAELDPKSPAPRFQLAQAYLALRKPELALAPLQSVVKLAPEERAARALLAQVYASQKRPREAYAQWSALAQSAPRDVEAHLQAATFAGALQLPREAEKWLHQGQNAAPKDPRPALMLGQLLLSQKQPARAAQVLAAATKTSPDTFEIYPMLADARLATGDFGGARGALQTALARLPKGQSADQKARIAVAEGQLHLSLGRVLGQSKQPQAARREFERAAQLLPLAAEPRGLLAVAALQIGDKKAAQSALERALQLDPTRTRDRLTLAQLLAQSGNLRAAEPQFAQYVKAQPRDVTALAQWSQVARGLKQPEKAAQILLKIADIDRKNPAPLLESGSLLRDSGQSAPALALFERALSRRPDDAGALFEVARLQSALKRPAALGSWQKFVAARPEFVPGYTALLEAGEHSGQSTSARLFLARQMARGKDNPLVLSAVLRFYSQKGRDSQAKALLADIVTRNPRSKVARAALDSFSTKTGSVEKPIAKTPIAKTPIAKTPIAKTPIAKTPIAKTPAIKNMEVAPTPVPTPIPAGSVFRVPVR